MLVQRLPDAARRHVFIVVPVDISRRSHVAPLYVRMTGLYFVREPSRCLRDDLKASYDGIECLFISLQSLDRMVASELLSELDVAKDIAKRPTFLLRMHTRCRVQWACAGAA